MRPDPIVKDYVSLFLYPFFFKEEKKVVREKIKTDSLWEAKEPDEAERSYFLPRTKELLFRDYYQYKLCQDVSLSLPTKELVLIDLPGLPQSFPANRVQTLPLKLTQISLSLFEFGVGIFIIGWEIKEDSLKFSDLLDLNESFRFIKPLGKWHKRPSIAGQYVEEYIASLLGPIFGPDGYETIFDERMITFSLAYLTDEFPPSLRYKFYNVDSWSMDLPSDEHQQTFLKQHTYLRWQNIGVEYGFTHYSGMGIITPRQDKTNFNPFWIKDHFRTLYLDIAKLLYFQYGVLVRIDKDLIETPILDKERFQEISRRYAAFVKNYWFDRVTDQDQGRELYRLWKGIIEEDYRLWETVKEKIMILRRS